MAPTDRDVAAAVDLEATRSRLDRQSVQLSELHTRQTRQDEQLDRIEALLVAIKSVFAAQEAREQRQFQARQDLASRLIDVLKTPWLWAALGVGAAGGIGGTTIANHRGLGWAGPLVLPERPERPTALLEGECIETAIVEGSAVDPLESCSGLVLPLSQWRYLESTNRWSEQIADLWSLRESQHQYQLAQLESEIARLSEPTPLLERSNTWLLVGAVSTAAILLGYNWSIQTAPR